MLIYILLLIQSLLSPSASFAKNPRRPIADWTYIETRLVDADFAPEFILALKDSYETTDFCQILELNTLLFLKRSDYHGIQVTADAEAVVRTFLQEHRASLKMAERRYGVSPGVIASLMWLESRFGDNEGTFHVPSVFLDLLQVDRPKNLQHLYLAAHRFKPRINAHDRAEIRLRAHKRVTWALTELTAIQKMYNKNHDVLEGFSGSFAGAFGIPQFLPSSYNQYARSKVKGQIPDLESADDAIQSVAFYLHQSGWRTRHQSSHVRALMKYNNSHDYAAAILKLARRSSPLPKENSKREPAKQ